MSDDIVVRIEGLWKRYGFSVPSILERGADWLKSIGVPGFLIGNLHNGSWALRDVDLEVKRGETLGIVGRNGAGKSTLLKVLAGVTPATRGRVEVHGRVFPMIELNAGIHKELTGRENVYLLGAVMGLTRREMTAKTPGIMDFCELGEWFDRPVRMYSSGMLARLGFGVAMNVNADILLIDEVLAVGDLVFQQKCFSQIEQMRRSGSTILFVSHSLRQLERISHRMIYLDDGSICAHGEPVKVLHAYQIASDKRTQANEKGGASQRAIVESSGEIEILEVKFLDRNREETNSFCTGSPMTIRIWYRAHVDVEKPHIAVRFNSADMILVSGRSILVEQSLMKGSGILDVKVEQLPFLRGGYSVDIGVKANNGRTMYQGLNVRTFYVKYTPEIMGDVGLVKTELTVSQIATPPHESD